MADRDLLSEIFSQPEHEVRSFMDTIRDTVQNGPETSDLENLDGKKHNVKAASSSKDQVSGLIHIETVWHKDDCAWHIAPAHPRRPWKVSEDRVLYTIMRVMSGTIPSTIRVDISLPYHDPEGNWDIKEITFKARDIRAAWNVSDKDLEKMVEQLFEALNELV